MRIARSPWLAPLVIVAVVAFGLAVRGRVPERVPIHWDVAGRADGWSDRTFAVLFAPAVAIALWLFLRFLARFEPRAGSARFRRTYPVFLNGVVLFFAVIQVAVLGSALGWRLDVPRVLLAAGGLLLAGMGAFFTETDRNGLVGIRTPWTLADAEVWRRTHRRGRPVFIGLGLLVALCATVAPVWLALAVLMAGLLAATLGLTAYSFRLARHGHGDPAA